MMVSKLNEKDRKIVSFFTDAICKKWNLKILGEFYQKPEQAISFSEFEKTIMGISPGILSKRLQELISLNVIQIIISDPRTPKKVKYFLTPVGRSLEPLYKTIVDLALTVPLSKKKKSSPKKQKDKSFRTMKAQQVKSA